MAADGTESERRVLVVTADDDFAADLDRHFTASAETTVAVAPTVSDALDVLADERVDCVVSDHDLPDADVVAFLAIVRARSPVLPLLLLTSDDGETVGPDPVAAGVTDTFDKSHLTDRWDQFAAVVDSAIDYHRAQRGVVDADTRRKTHLDAVSDVVAVVRDGRFDYLNETGREHLGVETAAAITGESVDDSVTIDSDARLSDVLATVVSGARSLVCTTGTLVRGDGTTRPVTLTAGRIERSDGSAAVLVCRSRRAESERSETRSLGNRVFDEAPVGITIADANADDTPLVYANEQFQQLTGYDEAEIRGHNARFLQGEGTDPNHVRELRDGLEREETVTTELQNYRKDGSEFWNRVTIAPLTNDAGDVTNYVGFQEDVTERRADEDLLRRFRRAVEAAGHGIYMTDPEGTITYVNPSFERITGYDAETVIGQTPAILKSGEMSADYYDALWETISAGEVWAEEIRDRRASGDHYYAEQTIAPLTDDDGEIEAYVAIQTDITDRKERETQLRQYERAIQGARESIAAVDENYQFLFANQSYREFHDLDEATVTDLTLPDVIGSEPFETVEPYVERAFDGHTVQYRMTRTRSDRSDRTFDIRYYPLEDDEGAVWGVVATMRDLTEQIERERQLASLDRMLRHNIYNELTVVDGRADILLDRASDELGEIARPIRESVERILDQADKHREIVELLSEPAELLSVDLDSMAAAVADRAAAANPTADITVDVPPIRLTTIPSIERALEEVIENAVIHSDRETPSVTITAQSDDGTVSISVSDDGNGIPPNERRVLTEESAVDPLSHSSGMGLWLVKRIVTRANGTLQFAERDPRGSVVTLVLPRGGHTDLATTRSRRSPADP